MTDVITVRLIISLDLAWVTSPIVTQDEESDFRTITSHLVQALCIIQGITFLHSASKEFMGRQLAMEVGCDRIKYTRDR